MTAGGELPTGRWAWIVLGILLTMAILALCGCSKTIYVETVRTDSTLITKWQRDSIWLHDSIYVREKQSGDTTYIMVERWHTKYVEKDRGDTVYVATHDTIPQPYEVVKEVERKKTWLEKLLEAVGGLVLIGGIGFAVWKWRWR